MKELRAERIELVADADSRFPLTEESGHDDDGAKWPSAHRKPVGAKSLASIFKAACQNGRSFGGVAAP